jgi:hypothetical protein
MRIKLSSVVSDLLEALKENTRLCELCVNMPHRYNGPALGPARPVAASRQNQKLATSSELWIGVACDPISFAGTARKAIQIEGSKSRSKSNSQPGLRVVCRLRSVTNLRDAMGAEDDHDGSGVLQSTRRFLLGTRLTGEHSASQRTAQGDGRGCVRGASATALRWL